MKVIKYNSYSDILIEFKNEELVHTDWKSFKKGTVRSAYDKTIFNVGFIGEGSYNVKENNKTTRYYKTWYDMLKRCYDKKYQEKHPTYKNCIVCNEWHNLQNFALWYEQNYYNVENQRMNLDKDILIKGNKIYSPETCIFVPARINLLFVKSNSIRGKYPIGVVLLKDIQKYYASCWNGNGKAIGLGCHNTPEEAFLSYKNFKENYIKEVAEEYKDKIPNILYESMINYIIEITD